VKQRNNTTRNTMKHHRNPQTLGILRDIKDAIRQPYAWPGGYPKTAITNDGGLLCPSCLQAEYRNVCHSTLNGWNDGWRVAAVDVIWEGGNHCDHCGVCVDAYPAETEVTV
jgi:hypothetical protein